MKRLLFIALMCGLTVGQAASAADDFPEPVNTQAPGEHPPSPREMLDLFELPDGFQVTLFAGEPDVQQPIAFDFDDRGRIWVAENYTYSSSGTVDPRQRDRVIILHDKDGDGEHDERKVFWDQGAMLTGLTWGFGGLWILNDGTLSFIPDKNGDDVPDGEPVEMLNGWTKNAGHNFVNGLLWGPDGWLYGRHGITETSYPGTPDTPQAERQPINCGIWRFHPTQHTFEVVCHGTTNPWGLDYNERGDMFMTNNVIGHLWHVIPGAHYERMFGQDFNPHLYELMPQIADHYHWDITGKWSESRDGAADDLGGGHSHCGGMIYYGQNFPEEYRGKMFMCNTHGRCVNVNRLERRGSTYVGRREPNFLKVNTPWFRGVELKYGPSGCVYLTDWADNGECHDRDGVHRTSGRIYRISYGDVKSRTNAFADGKAADLWISALYSHLDGEWQRRKTARLFIERYPDASGEERAGILSMTGDLWSDEEENQIPNARAFDLLAAVDALEEQHLAQAMISPNELIRKRTVELVASMSGEHPTLEGLLNAWISYREESPTVLLAFASAVQRNAQRIDGTAWNVFPRHSSVVKLTGAVHEDRALQLMTWYAMERLNQVGRDVPPVAWLRDPKLRAFQLRWMASNWPARYEHVVNELQIWLQMLDAPSATRLIEEPKVATREILQGIAAGIKGQINLKVPAGWDEIGRSIARLEDHEADRLWAEISAALGDKAAIHQLRELIRDRGGDHVARSNAIQSLAEQRDTDAIPIFLSLLTDRAVYADVARALAAFEDPRIPKELLKRWNNLRHGSQEAAMDTLISRKSYAQALAGAIDDGRVDSAALSAGQVRQLMSFNDPAITKIIAAKWGVINESSEAKETAIAAWKNKLTPDVVAAANLENGAALFRKSCANCHRLYGEGGRIGPDLTGANRGNLHYILSNVIDPSAEVPRQFTASVMALKSGRVITGVVIGETEQTLTVQTDKEQMVIAVDDVEERTQTTRSLMPDGLLDSLTEQQVLDLMAFVMHRR